MYLALYRKYRPRTFDDVISQEHITTTLKNQVANGAAAHAYLFTGSRGTGKTSCAKIMAMAVNCLDPKNGNPCLECENCRSILNGEATDVVEMDAASNRGIEDVRRLREEVVYTPVSCKYRVYIIDEVHMISSEAFNALLKTLEEPPAHVKFILATTELHKIPSTITSRCQRFEFKRIDIGESAKRLLEVAEKESVTLDSDAADLISRLSDGGMRDALSLLDRCITADRHITSQTVRDCAGVADNKHLFAFSEMIASGDVAGCARLIGELHKNSKDLAIMIGELSEHFRDLMLCKSAPNETGLLSALPDEYGEISRIAAMYGLEDIFRCLSLLQECSDNIGKSKQRKMLAEMCLVKMCTGFAVRTSLHQPNATVSTPRLEITAQIPPSQPQDAIPREIAAQAPTPRASVSTPHSEITETAERVSTEEPDVPFTPQIPDAPEIQEPPFEAPLEDSVASVPPPTDVPWNVDVPKIPEPPKELSEGQWKDAVERLVPMYSVLFSDSEAKLSGNVLEVTTANRMLLENVKGEELTNVGKMISEKLGFKVELILKEHTEEKENEEALSKVDKLLAKARQLGIEVQTKNN